jgi:hypothetical protein
MAAALAAGAQDAAPPASEPVPVPDPELLQFLAEFGDAQGKFADPAEVAGALERADDPATAGDTETDADDADDPPHR